MVQKDPDAARPTVLFPEQFKTDDVLLNTFIRKAMDSCAEGDYDKFRQLFGVTYEPPDGVQFERVWKGVKEIRIAGIHQDPSRPLDYYVHIVVQLRQPDRLDRTERQAVIWIFKEADEWRMAPAPGDIQGLILYDTTQPAGEAPTTTRPTRRHAGSRPSTRATSPVP